VSEQRERSGRERNPVFERYLSTTFRQRNDISEAGLAKAGRACAREFGEYLPADREAPILEVGCGVGAFMCLCEERGHTAVHGIDISDEQVSFCRQRGLDNVECIDALSFLETDDGRYALILMSDTLEHLPKDDLLPALRAARERLAADGRLVLRVPNLSNPLNLRTRYVDFTHQVGLTRESLAQVLRISGLEVERVYGSVYPHRRWLARVVFDRLLWWAFRIFYRHTMQLKDTPVRGKNLIAVARRGGA
jgi:2-polyprenyl-3-methyl-5-hydroxy-6-metoxy-1,4-benzoquinol methylase